MKAIPFSICFLLITFNYARSQANLTGTWKGTSICQVKNSPCHDEIVVYHISKKTVADSFTVTANKIVNGVEVDMGILQFRFDRKKNQLISATDKVTWTFNVKDKSMDGTLYVQGTLFRIIKLTKEQ